MAMKRSGTEGGASPSKRVKGDSTESQVQRIVATLQDEDLPSELPTSVRLMLCKGASAFTSTSDNRHVMQAMVIEQIKDTLTDIASQLEKKVVEASAASDLTKAELEKVSPELSAASLEVSEAHSAVDAQKDTVATSQKAVAEAEREVKAVETRRKQNSKAQEALQKEKGKISALEDGVLKPLLEGTSEKEAKKLVEKLCKSFGKLEAGSSLRASFSAAVFKRPETRKDFDRKAIDSVKEVLTSETSIIDGRVSEKQSEACELEAEVEKIKEVVEQARCAKASQAEVLKSLETARDEKIALRASLLAKAEQFNTDITNLKATIAQKEEQLTELKKVQGDLEFLVQRSSADASVASPGSLRRWNATALSVAEETAPEKETEKKNDTAETTTA